MNKTLLFAIAATVSANTWAGTDHLVVNYEKEWVGAADRCAKGAWASDDSQDYAAIWGGHYGSPEATAYAEAWSAALALVKVKAHAKADFAIFRNVPRGLVKNVNFNAALSSSVVTVALAEGTAEAIGSGDSASYAVSIQGKPWAGAAAVGAGFAQGEALGAADASAYSVAGSMSKALSKVSVNSYGIRQFEAGLLMGNHSYAAASAEANAVADALAKTFVVSMTYIRQFWHKSVDVSADHDYAAAQALAHAFAGALAKGSVAVSVKALYNQRGFGHKRGWKTEQFDLTGDAQVWLGCAAWAGAYTDASAVVNPSRTRAWEETEY
jgi:hypothetical protein